MTNIEQALGNLDVDIMVEAGKWDVMLPDYQSLIDQAILEVAKNTVEGAYFKKFVHLELSIVLSSDKMLHQLNQEYREKDKPTNVLSFPAFSDDDIESYFRKGKNIPEMPFSLGDIIISLETIEKEAISSSIALADHFSHMMLHGLLHLLGYDHIIDDEAEQMEALETMLLKGLNIKDPYNI